MTWLNGEKRSLGSEKIVTEALRHQEASGAERDRERSRSRRSSRAQGELLGDGRRVAQHHGFGGESTARMGTVVMIEHANRVGWIFFCDGGARLVYLADLFCQLFGGARSTPRSGRAIWGDDFGGRFCGRSRRGNR